MRRKRGERYLVETYRGFKLFAWRQDGGDWFGMAKGFGTVIFPRLGATRDAAVADMRARCDACHARCGRSDVA